MVRLFLALISGKLIFFLTRILKAGGGSAAPGFYALKIFPNLVSTLSKQIRTQIIITGTNGKTTTARLVSHFLGAQGMKVIKNSTGSNLERGIASELIRDYSFFSFGLKSRDLAIWEVDEAAFNEMITQIKPQAIVFLNAFRDQLDRYGEVNSVVNKWCESLEKVSKNTLVIINSDDQNVAKLEDCFSGKVQRLGIKGEKILGENKSVKRHEQKLDFEASSIKSNGLESVSFQLTANDQRLIAELPLPGVYHIYDFLAAFAVGVNLNLDGSSMIASLENYSPAFGRMEKLRLSEKDLYIFLIKNPVGATEVFKTIKGELHPSDSLFMALNDNFADGTDVSWIWDAEFEKLVVSSKLSVVSSGTRAEDLAVRLKYAGFEDIRVIKDIEKGLNIAVKESGGRIFVLPTYTAMLELQKILAKKGVKKEYWKEEV